MRRTIFLALFALFSASPARAAIEPQVISLTDVVQKVSTENYNVLGNALRVYQAKEAIQVARGDLLPKLNLWRLVGIAYDPTSVIGMIEDIAPFLVPANWFRVQEQKFLYLAEKEAYRALWANEVMTAKALYLHALVDQTLLKHIEDGRKELEEVMVIVRMRELLGGVKPGTARDIEVRLLALQEDKRALEVVIAQELSLLSYMMGIKGNAEVVLTPVAIPPIESLKPISYDDFEFRALDSAPELRQYGYFLQAAGQVEKEISYSFLGGSSLSRGVAGGVFDDVPVSGGLGFGSGASMRIAKAKKEMLKTQSTGIGETIKRQLSLVINNYNLDLENYGNLKRRLELSEQALAQVQERIRLGEQVDVLELVESSRNHLQADTAFFNVKVRFLTNEDRLARLIFHGDYSKPPVAIEDVRRRP